MTTTPAPRAPLATIVGSLPDVGLELFTQTQRAAARAAHTTGDVVRATADVVSRPAPIQASLHAVAVRVTPIQARGAARRHAEAERVALVVRAVVDTLIDAAMGLVERVPIDKLIAQVDLNAVLAQVDLNALLASVDLGPVINNALADLDIGALMRESTTGVGAEMRDAGRATAMHGDEIVAKVFDKVLRRRARNLEVGLAT
jgi:hypothetical protein